MTFTSTKLSLAAIALFVPTLIAAALAGPGYAIVAFLVGLTVVGGLAVGGVVATAGDGAPFSEDSSTPAGDTPEHSSVSSAATASRR